MTDLSLYRPNVGVVLFNRSGQAWFGRRVSTHGEFAWQFPQGGVDKGEDMLTAARRELQEETGVVSTSYLGVTGGWITYDFPEDWNGSKAARGWRGQRQVWFAMRFEGDEAEIDLNAHLPAEFDAWRWGDLDEAPDLIVPFKREAYETVVRSFRPFAESLRRSRAG